MRLARCLVGVAALMVGAAGLTACTAAPATNSPSASPGLSAGTTVATTAPPPSPFPTAPPTDPGIVFAADGIGGYLIGADLTDLVTRKMVTNIVPNPLCVDTKTADATGPYAGKLTLTFRAARLTAIHSSAPADVTPSGAKVGTPLADLQSIYGNRGTIITGKAGASALSVRVPASTLALVFTLDPATKTVTVLNGGEAQALEDAVSTGQAC